MKTIIETSKNKIVHYAQEALGFDDCRFTTPFLGENLKTYKQWIKEGKHGDMGYLAGHSKFKENPELLLKNVKSAIVVIKNYKNTKTRKLKNPFKIARYAVGRDYHEVMGKRLAQIADFIKVDSLEYLSLAGMMSAVKNSKNFCSACFTGKYPVEIPKNTSKYLLEGAS